MTADIYEQHSRAFSRVSAYVILKGEKRVATVAIKFPADGAGRLWAYTHFLGLPMTRHHADGYSYDKRSPAVIGGFKKAWEHAKGERQHGAFVDLIAALDWRSEHGGEDYWNNNLERAGYRVFQAV